MDVVVLDAIMCLKERNPPLVPPLDTDIADCIERLAGEEFDGPVSRLRSGSLVGNGPVPPVSIYYQRHPGELLIVRVCHQMRRPIAR